MIWSFEQRLEAEIPALRRYAAVLLRDADKAEDLLQDCLERALQRRHLWRPLSLRGWLFRMMRNLYLNDRRRRSRDPTRFPLDLSDGSLPARQSLALEVSQVLANFGQLSDEQREALLLVSVEDMSYRQAARILKTSEGTVASRVARARERLHHLSQGELIPPIRRVK